MAVVYNRNLHEDKNSRPIFLTRQNRHPPSTGRPPRTVGGTWHSSVDCVANAQSGGATYQSQGPREAAACHPGHMGCMPDDITAAMPALISTCRLPLAPLFAPDWIKGMVSPLIRVPCHASLPHSVRLSSHFLTFSSCFLGSWRDLNSQHEVGHARVLTMYA